MPAEPHYRIRDARASLERDLAVIRRFGVEAKYEISAKGGPDYYSLTDMEDGECLGSLELRPIPAEYLVGIDGQMYHSGELQEKLVEMLQTPRDQLKMLLKAAKVLSSDIDEAENRWGIEFYRPSALPLHERFPERQKQILWATMEYFKGDFYSSSRDIGVVPVNVSEYVLGRREYPSQSIYQKGDLRKAFAAEHKVFLSYVGRVMHNESQMGDTASGLHKRNWKKLRENLLVEFADVFTGIGTVAVVPG